MDDRIRIRSQEILSDDWAILKKTTFDYRRRDGVWETQVRQTYDRGDGAAILPFDPDRGTVLLVRQFRWPAFVTGKRVQPRGQFVDAVAKKCVGLLDLRDGGRIDQPADQPDGEVRLGQCGQKRLTLALFAKRIRAAWLSCLGLDVEPDFAA